ncbi:MAG: NAD-dependent epimerase/dehydratase [Gammaproteobacteria bacterium]|jgi:nucleoside-diphosphate-sugar epimerase|nr:NAD-dependent epimerase/dehydratase [Gammaproteobacteria bacterium]
MKHLVTGGSGFLGNMIARRLLSSGEEVRVVDIWRDETQPKEIEFQFCDVTDRAAVAKAMQGIDAVHHNAALVPLTKSGKKFWEVNVVGSQIVAEEALKAGVKCFIHMSSSAIFGAPTQHPITNATPTQPIEIYGRSKLAGELAVKKALENTDVNLIIIRPRTILGNERLGIFQILFEWIHENRNIFILGSGNHGFQFIHAEDLMDAYMLAWEKQKPGAYNVGTDRFGTLREGLEHLIAHAGSTSKVKSIPPSLAIPLLKFLDFIKLSPLAPWHYLTYHKPFYFDVSDLTELGWKPKYSNDEMLQSSYESYIKLLSEKKEIGGAVSSHRKNVNQRILSFIKRL